MPIFGTRRKPKGPQLSNTHSFKITMSGIHLSLEYPKSNDWVYQKVEDLAGPLNLYDPSIYFKDDSPSGLSWCCLIGKNWVFHGLPIISGDYIGRLGMAVSVFHMPTFKNLFRQRRFQCAMERYNFKTSVKNIPIENVSNYKCQTINGTDWANYDGNTEDTQVFQTVWQTPITDEHLLTIRFSQDGEFKNSGLKAAFSKVIDLVMSSVKLELPSDIQAQKEAVNKAFPYESFPESLPPFLFEYYWPKGRYDIIDLISTKYNHEVPPEMQESFDQEVNELEALEKLKQQATHQKNLDHQMRFKALEAEDLKKFNSQNG